MYAVNVWEGNNMTANEIVKALRCNANCDKFYKEHEYDCSECPMPYKNETQRACISFDTEVLPQASDLIEQLQKELEAAKRDLKDSIYNSFGCVYCKHQRIDRDTFYCDLECDDEHNLFERRGVCKNTEETT